jgi:hypothetical protein
MGTYIPRVLLLRILHDNPSQFPRFGIKGVSLYKWTEFIILEVLYVTKTTNETGSMPPRSH